MSEGRCSSHELWALPGRELIVGDGVVELMDRVPNDDVSRAVEYFRTNGYVLITQLLDPSSVRCVGDEVIARATELGVYPATAGGTGLRSGTDPIAQVAAYVALTEHHRLMTLAGALLGEPASVYPHRWLRTVPPGGYTGLHSDSVYLDDASHECVTAWMPLKDVHLSAGPLAVCPRSHVSTSFHDVRETYGRCDAVRERVDGWLDPDPVEFLTRRGGRLATSCMRAGDVLFFGPDVLHLSGVNTTSDVRLTSDTRYFPSRIPGDPKWHEDGEALMRRLWSAGPTQSVESLRAKWGY